MKRIYYLDNIKFVAVISIVCMHVYETMYPENCISLEIIGRIGVPLFSIVTGVLMLPRDYTKKTLANYYKKTFIPLFITTEIWILFWSLYVGLDVRETINSLFLLENPCPTMWYARMICRLYLIMPFFCIIIHRFKLLSLLGMCGVFILYSNFYLFDFSWILAKLHLADTNFMLYFLYMYIGYQMRNIKYSSLYYAIIALSIVAIFVCMNYFDTFLWYNSPLLIIMSVFVYHVLKKLLSKQNNAMCEISKKSYGIYLSHMVFVMILVKCGITIPQGHVYMIPILSCLVIVINSFLIDIVHSIAPKYSRYLFRI